MRLEDAYSGRVQPQGHPELGLVRPLQDSYVMGSLVDLCAKSIASEPHKYHAYYQKDGYCSDYHNFGL